MTTETKNPTATIGTTGLTIDFTDRHGEDRYLIINITVDGHISIEDTAGSEYQIECPTREAALAIAEAFTRLAQELPEAPTE